jgi:alpha-glucosidase (family GH31 glycosyl hydrolase)
MARQAHDSGIPLCRGLYIDYPNVSQAYRYDEFLFGDNFLAAPILTPSSATLRDTASRTLWLPEGTWYDYFTQRAYPGNRDMTVRKSLFEFPLYVKAGSIIPIAPYTEYASAPMDTMLLHAYTPLKSGRSVFRLYEDDGESFAFEQNQFRQTNICYDYTKASCQKIILQPATGSFRGNIDRRAYAITVIHTSKPKYVAINGRRIAAGASSGDRWTWDAEHKNIRIVVATRSVHSATIITCRL